MLHTHHKKENSVQIARTFDSRTLTFDTRTQVRHAVHVGTYGKGLKTSITNHDPTRTHSVTFSEFVPWFLKLKYHTLRVVVGSHDVTKMLWESNGKNLFVRTAEHRGRPAVTEIRLNIPPLGTSIPHIFLP